MSLFFTLQMLAGLQPTTLPENEMAPAAVEKLKAEKVTFSGGQNYQKGLKLTTKRRRWLGACPMPHLPFLVGGFLQRSLLKTTRVG